MEARILFDQSVGPRGASFECLYGSSSESVRLLFPARVVSRVRSATRFSYAKADWGLYTSRVEEGIRALPERDEITSVKGAGLPSFSLVFGAFPRVVPEAAAAAIPR